MISRSRGSGVPSKRRSVSLVMSSSVVVVGAFVIAIAISPCGCRAGAGRGALPGRPGASGPELYSRSPPLPDVHDWVRLPIAREEFVQALELRPTNGHVVQLFSCQLHAFHDHRDPLTDADAHGGQAVAAVAPAEGVHERGEEARAG